MLGRKLKNSGMTLVEVLVSMLVLSIAAVTVISAFSMAAQVNTKAKKQQGTAALMENMLEYAEAGGEDYAGWFGGDYTDLTPVVTPAPGVTPTPQTLKIEELQNVQSGLLNYTVKITTDTAPTKYNNGVGGVNLLNDFNVIQFGGSDSNAILIDATSSSYDEMAKAVFYGLHEQAIIEHDAEEIAEAEEDEDYVAQLWQGTSEQKTDTEVMKTLDREIWIQSQAEGGSADKFRLVAYMAYKTDGSVHMPDTIDTGTYTYQVPLCYSEVFDSEASAEASPKHLGQIYLLYSEQSPDLKVLTEDVNVDVRIWDPGQVLTVNMYIVKQATNGKQVFDPTTGELTSAFTGAVTNGGFDQYFSGADEKVIISCEVPNALISTVQSPKSAEIYSPLTVKLKDGACDTNKVTAKSKDLVAESDEIRVVTVKIEIIDPDTGNVLAEEEVTRLQ